MCVSTVYSVLFLISVDKNHMHVTWVGLEPTQPLLYMSSSFLPNNPLFT